MSRPTSEVEFDPADWESFRRLAHRMLDETIDSVRDVRDEPAWQRPPSSTREALDRPLPRHGLGDEGTYAQFREAIRPYTNGNRHPGFFGWAQGGGTPLAMMAEMLAAAMNPHCGGFEQASKYVEKQVLDWLREMMGFPEDSSGVLLSGGSMANFVGLAAARDDRAGFDVWSEGLQGDRPRMVFYASDEMHGWAPKAANLLGLGNDSFRAVPVDEHWRLPIDELRRRIHADRESGLQPFCVMASAGTVNTGAVDELENIAALCREEDLWFHVDGAFGAWARISSTHADAVRGIELADSLAFDLHKWGSLPFEIACVLVRDPAAHERPFTIKGGYIHDAERGPFDGGIPFAQQGIELTRGFKALKAWMSLTSCGVDQHAAVIDQNLAQAERLRALVDASSVLELTAPASLNIVCFRAAAEGHSEEELDALNQELLYRLQESGRFVPSGTTLSGRFCLRAAIINHRTRSHDIDGLAELAEKISAELLRA